MRYRNARCYDHIILRIEMLVVFDMASSATTNAKPKHACKLKKRAVKPPHPNCEVKLPALLQRLGGRAQRRREQSQSVMSDFLANEYRIASTDKPTTQCDKDDYTKI